jgi:hypothetical protein
MTWPAAESLRVHGNACAATEPATLPLLSPWPVHVPRAHGAYVLPGCAPASSGRPVQCRPAQAGTATRRTAAPRHDADAPCRAPVRRSILLRTPGRAERAPTYRAATGVRSPPHGARARTVPRALAKAMMSANMGYGRPGSSGAFGVAVAARRPRLPPPRSVSSSRRSLAPSPKHSWPQGLRCAIRTW